ncbi:hypothetical protein [Vibrio crassostreae]|uniref:hypothetical protein n=1 Tax=Vibrio crassostreae TaxID=246167 RepID=UPI001B316386|nr:hypothetical protein [Vibrio crassostreae]
MNNESGLIHSVVKDKKGKLFTLLGVSNFEEIDGKPSVFLVNADNIIVSVSQDALKKNYSLDRKLKIYRSKTESLREVTPLSPVMIFYTGVKYLMLGVVETGSQHKLALYQTMDGGEVFTMPIEEFYDQFSIGYEVGFSNQPLELDELGNLGFIVNQTAVNTSKFPVLMIQYNGQTGSLSSENISLH